MIRLPIPGSDNGTWGTILNDFLEVSHNDDGTLKVGSLTAAGAESSSNKGTAGGYASLGTTGLVPTSQLGAGTASTSTYLRGDGSWSSVPIGTATSSGAVSSVAGKTGAVTLTESDIKNLTSDLAGKATDSAVVHTSGNETIADVKTFSSAPVIPTAALPESAIADLTGDLAAKAPLANPTFTGTVTLPADPTSNLQAATKHYVDTTAAAGAPDATTTNKGIVQLTDDLGGTATAPTVVGTHLSTPLPVSQGGTGSATQNFVGSVTAGDGTITTGGTATAPTVKVGAIAESQVTSLTSDLGNRVQIGGDLSGSATSPTVARVNGITLPASAPVANQVLTATSGTATAWSTPAGGVVLDTTSSDIAPLGTQAAGAVGKAADSGHVHAMPTLNQVNAPTAGVSMNAQKLTGLANGTVGTDAAAFGQIPTASVGITNASGAWSVTYGTSSTTAAVGNDARFAGSAAGTAGASLSATDPTTTNARTPTGSAGGDLSGTYPNPSVAKISGVSVSGTPTSGQVITATTSSAASWSTPSGGGVTSFNTRAGAVTFALADGTGVGLAPVASPTLTGVPVAPTAAAGTNTTQLATTAFVQSAITPNTPVAESSNYQMLTADSLVLASGTITITLPTAPSVGGLYAVMNAATGTVTVAPGAGVLRGTSSLATQYEICTYIFDGTNWDCISVQPAASATVTENVNTVAASGTAQTIPDVTTATLNYITLSGNCTFTFPAAAAGKSFTVILIQDATGSRTATWPATVKWPGGVTPTITATASTGLDMLTFVCGDGTHWLGNYQQGFA